MGIETFAHRPAAPRGGVTKVGHIAQQQQPSAIFAAMSVDLLDDRYFLINLILTVTMQMLGFAVSALCKSEQLFDFIGGLNFIACAVMTMVLKDSYDDRTIAIVTVVVASRLYLAGFLAFRVIKRKGDTRFDNVRENNLKIFAAFFYQIIWVYTVSTPGAGELTISRGAFTVKPNALA